MKKKLLALLLVAVMVISLVPISALAASPTCPSCGASNYVVDKRVCDTGLELLKCMEPTASGQPCRTTWPQPSGVLGHKFTDGVCICGAADPDYNPSVNCDHSLTVLVDKATCQYAAYYRCDCGQKSGEVGQPDPTAHTFVNGICACGAKESACEHKETYADITEASCVKTGLEKTICKACGETVKEETLPKNDNHAFYNGTCLLCGAAEHTCVYDILVAKATCQAPAYYQCECGNGKEIGNVDPENHTFVDGKCACGATTCVDEFDHEYVNGVCRFCGAEKEDYIEDCDHVGYTYTDTFEATCKKDGWKKTYCKNCGLLSTEVLPKNDNHAFYQGTCLLCGAEEHTCVYDILIAKATCQAPAYYQCECGNGKEVGNVDPENHTFVDGKCACGATTCVDEFDHEYVNGVCRFCGAEKEDYVQDCDHVGYTYTDTFEATCKKDGWKKTYCKNCGLLSTEVLPKENGSHAFYNGKCLLCGAEEHTCVYDILIAEATCQSPAYYQCECGNGKEVGLPNDEHGETYTDTVMASCVKEGLKKTICKDCGETVKEEVLEKNDDHSFYNGKCLLCGKLEKCEHDETYVDIFEASCVKEGSKKTICKACGETVKEETLPVNDNHAFYNGKCLLCGKLEKCEHDETYVDIFEASCVKEGSKKTICKACGETIKEETLPENDNHAFYNGKCLLCGKLDECEHNYEVVKEQAGTCAEAGYVWTKCSICGDEKNYETEVDADAHEFEVVKEEEGTCVVPGYVWEKCANCGTEKNHETVVSDVHNYETVKELAPTCAEPGYVWLKCADCGAEKNHEVGEASGEHSGETCVDIFEASCVKEGVKKTICKACGDVLAEEVLPVNDNHAFYNGKCLLCGIDEEPVEKPTEPEEKPTEPEEKPTEPEEKPTEPEEKPTEPEEKPTEPEEKPTEPEEEPTEKPTEKPADPELDDVPKTGTNTGMILATMTGIALICAMAFVFGKKRSAC